MNMYQAGRGVFTLLTTPPPLPLSFHLWDLSPTWANIPLSLSPTVAQSISHLPRRYRSVTFEKVRIVRLLTNA